MDSKRFFFLLLEAASNSTRIMGEAGDLIVFMRGEMLGKCWEVKRFQYFRTISSKAKFSRYSTRLSNSTRLYAQAVSHVSTCSTPFLSHPTSFSVGIAPSIFP